MSKERKTIQIKNEKTTQCADNQIRRSLDIPITCSDAYGYDAIPDIKTRTR